jgi:hypothetical protein
LHSLQSCILPFRMISLLRSLNLTLSRSSNGTRLILMENFSDRRE